MLEETKGLLQDFEAHLVKVYTDEVPETETEDSFRFCILKLAVKCSSLLQAISILLSKDFIAEANALSRIFQETFTYLQHFIVYQGENSKFRKWTESPDKPLDERVEKLRKEVDDYWNARYNPTSFYEPFWRGNFILFSNISVHPTFRCIELSFNEAGHRHLEKLFKEESDRKYLTEGFKGYANPLIGIYCIETEFYLKL